MCLMATPGYWISNWFIKLQTKPPTEIPIILSHIGDIFDEEGRVGTLKKTTLPVP